MPINIRQQAIYVRSGDPATENEPVDLYPGQMGMRVTTTEPWNPVGTAGAGSGGGVGGANVASGTAAPPQFRQKTWQKVRCDSAMTVAPFLGALAWWSDRSRYLVTTSPTVQGRNAVAGTFGSSVAPTAGACFVQTQGPAVVKLVDAPAGGVPAAGAALAVIPSATAAKADTVAAGTAPPYPSIGTTEGAMFGGDNTVTVNLDIPETT